MEENTFINVSKDMMSFIEKSPTAFQVTANFMDLLDDAGFVRLNERDRWHLIPGGKYYVTRNDSSIIAFRMPAAEGFINYQIAAAHSDSPSFKVKENPELTPDKNYVSLNVEKYGGMLMAPWFDRPLSVAGRAIVREGAVLKPVLVNVDRDLCIIPNLAIHMNREANTGLNYNAQKDMIPLIGETESKGLFDSIIADAAQTDKESVISSDLFLYNRQAGTIWGADNEFISAPRLDDVMCAYSCMNALMDSDESNQESVAVCAVFDNEEVGSSTKQGADSTFLSDVLMRIAVCAGKDNEDYIRACAGSFMLSADNAHAVHPNYQEKADPTLFIFDEPTTGLHFHDIRKLLDAFDALIRRGHSIVIIEHNLDVVKCADHVIDLGPEGGDKGGNIVATGTPEEVAKCAASYTGQFLQEKLHPSLP